MAKLYISLTPEEVRASIPYDLICMVRYGCTWNTGRRRRAWQLDFTEDEKKAAGRLFRRKQRRRLRFQHRFLSARSRPAGIPDYRQ